MRRVEVIDGLERNWQEEKRLIDEKSINNRWTEAERVTRRTETIDGLKRNGRLEQQKQLTDYKAKRVRREAFNRQEEQKQSTD